MMHASVVISKCQIMVDSPKKTKKFQSLPCWQTTKLKQRQNILNLNKMLGFKNFRCSGKVVNQSLTSSESTERQSVAISFSLALELNTTLHHLFSEPQAFSNNVDIFKFWLLVHFIFIWHLDFTLVPRCSKMVVQWTTYFKS